MSREIQGKIYYETGEVCQKVGVSRQTLNRWLKSGFLPSICRDRKGWRLFTEEDINAIERESKRIRIEYLKPAPVKNSG
jgi:predicted site-specific integrase-resolvase